MRGRGTLRKTTSTRTRWSATYEKWWRRSQYLDMKTPNDCTPRRGSCDERDEGDDDGGRMKEKERSG